MVADPLQGASTKRRGRTGIAAALGALAVLLVLRAVFAPAVGTQRRPSPASPVARPPSPSQEETVATTPDIPSAGEPANAVAPPVPPAVPSARREEPPLRVVYHVQDSLGNPIAGCRVGGGRKWYGSFAHHGQEDETDRGGLTDEKGEHRFRKVHVYVGRWEFHARKDGYVTARKVEYDVDGVNPTHAWLTLEEAGVIEGRAVGPITPAQMQEVFVDFRDTTEQGYQLGEWHEGNDFSFAGTSYCLRPDGSFRTTKAPRGRQLYVHLWSPNVPIKRAVAPTFADAGPLEITLEFDPSVTRLSYRLENLGGARELRFEVLEPPRWPGMPPGRILADQLGLTPSQPAGIVGLAPGTYVARIVAVESNMRHAPKSRAEMEAINRVLIESFSLAAAGVEEERTFVLREGAMVELRVIDRATGRGVPGAECQIECNEEVVTYGFRRIVGDGHWLIAPLDPGTGNRWTVVTRAEGYLGRRDALPLEAGRWTEVEILLAPGRGED